MAAMLSFENQESGFLSWADVYAEQDWAFAYDASKLKAKSVDDDKESVTSTAHEHLSSFADTSSDEDEDSDGEQSDHVQDAKVLAEQMVHTRAQGRIVQGWALSLQDDMLEALEKPGFQDELLLLLRECGADAAKNLHGRESLCLSALCDVLPQYGFECTPAGMEEAFQVLEALVSNDSSENTMILYDRLGLAPPQERGSVPWCV